MKWSTDFCNSHEGAPVDGDYYDLPGVTVYTTHKHPLAGKGRVEVNRVNPQSQEHFHWRIEITLDDLENELYKHLLLQTDDQVVETYGKTVTPLNDHQALEILEELKRLTAAAETS